MRLVGRRAVVDPEAIGKRVGPMFEEVSAALRHVDGALATPIATYAEVDDGMEVAVGYAWAARPRTGPRPWTSPRPPPSAASTSARWRDRGVVAGAAPLGSPTTATTTTARAVRSYVRAESDDQADWVTELQQPVTR